MAKTTTTRRVTRMTPSKNAVPFAGVTVPEPIIARIDRGVRDLAANYGLKNLLRWTMTNESVGWRFELLNTAEEKPLVTMTNKSIGGLNRFLTACGAVISKKYGQAETKQRKTA